MHTIENPGREGSSDFTKIPGDRGSGGVNPFAQGSPILGVITFVLTSFSFNLPGGPMVYPLPPSPPCFDEVLPQNCK